MFYISNIEGDNIFVTDTSDNCVDCFTSNELMGVMLANPDLIVRGVGLSMSQDGQILFGFERFILSELDKLKLSGAKAPIGKYCRLPNESSPRNHYHCFNCNKVVDNKPTMCTCGAKFIWQGMYKSSKSFITSSTGERLLFTSVNGLKNMMKEKRLKLV